MQGLRTQEGIKFERFFSLVEEEAKKKNAVFFLDSGEGNDFENNDMEGENLSGWLIQNNKTNEFETAYIDRADLSKWIDCYAWASWENKGGEIIVNIEML